MGRLNFLLVFALVFRLFIIDALADDELSQIAFTKPLGKDFEEDYQRGNEAIHCVHTLAELGAGYEAARVLAAIAWQEGDTDFGNQARHILHE